MKLFLLTPLNKEKQSEMINEQPRHRHLSSSSSYTFSRCSSTWRPVSLPSVVFSGAASACVSCRFLPGCVFAFALSSGLFSQMMLHWLCGIFGYFLSHADFFPFIKFFTLKWWLLSPVHWFQTSLERNFEPLLIPLRAGTWNLWKGLHRAFSHSSAQIWSVPQRDYDLQDNPGVLCRLLPERLPSTQIWERNPLLPTLEPFLSSQGLFFWPYRNLVSIFFPLY